MEKPPNDILAARDVVMAVNKDTKVPYNLFKERLLGMFKPSPWAQANKLLDYLEQGSGQHSTMIAARR